MNLPDGKQLVRESSGNIEEQQNKRKMGLHAKLAWIALFFCLGLIALAHCVPVEVIYTGEGCACPTKLDFSVNVPNLPKPRKYYMPYDYGYKVEVPPRPAKAKVSYSFDFTVEEPQPPKKRRPCSNQHLYAKIDRVAVKKGDCEDSYAAPTAPSNCRCGQCDITKPLYRYVFDDNMSPPPPPLPCKCQRPNCKCNLSRAASTASTAYSPNAIFMLNQPVSDLMSAPNFLETGGDEGDEAYYVNSNGSGGMEVGTGNKRRKRDLQRTLFGPRKLAKERQGRFMKLYHKNLSDRPHRLFDLEGLSNRQRQPQRQSEPKKAKRKVQRKAKKTRYTHKRSRLVRRDIKGEYELLEKEREQMDLTLPEIIQFMPETLQPDFKRGQCYFGCGSQQPDLPAKSTESDPSENPTSTEYSIISHEINTDNPDVTITYTDTNSSKERTIDMSMDIQDMHTNGEAAALNENSNINRAPVKQHEKEPRNETKETKDSAQQNFITSSYKKRNAANYFNGRSTPTTDSAQSKRAYHAQTATAQPIFTDPNYMPHQSTYTKTAQSAAPVKSTVTAKVPAPPHYFYDHLGRKYSENNDRVRAVTTISVPDPLDHNATPLSYAGDLEIPPASYATHTQYGGGGGGGMPPSAHAESYPVQHISNEQLDKIISDIIFRHPEFIDATKHFAGALVDPEPLQEMETISFLKKLIDGRLNLWFGQEDEYNPPQYSTSYSGDPHDYGIPQLHDLLPPLY